MPWHVDRMTLREVILYVRYMDVAAQLPTSL